MKLLCTLAFVAGSSLCVILAAQPAARRNVIVFIADGLRPGSVNATDAPTLLMVRTEGVNFTNSHSLLPTLTMTNAAAIATGHYPGDTGQFNNSLYVGRQMFTTGNFGRTAGTLTPNTEDDQVLGDLDETFGGNYGNEITLMAAARMAGYNTAAIGKIGPTAIQDVSQLQPVRRVFTVPSTVILDGLTGTAAGVPVSAEIARLLAAAGLGDGPPARTQAAGTNVTPGSLTANVAHYHWLADAATKAVLPAFVMNGKPFMLAFWSGDPDQTQHAQGDSLNSLTPGINGATSRSAVQNADSLLRQLLDFINSNPSLRDNTDVVVTGDHGFSTVSRRAIDASGHPTSSYSASFVYRDVTGRQEVNSGALPTGHFVIDLAHALNLPMFAPDLQVTGGSGATYARIDPTLPQQTAIARQHPIAGALIGGTGRVLDPDARIVVAGNSLYVPGRDRALVRTIVEVLAAQDYTGALLVDDSYGAITGALPLSAIGLRGSSPLPSPAVIFAAREFALDPSNPLMTSVVVEGTPMQEGQGDHGAFARSNTFNNMAAIGPDFKKRFADAAPVGNADLAPTLARIMGFSLPRKGGVVGRVLSDALAGGGPVDARQRVARSRSTRDGKATILVYQEVGRQRYYDYVCFTPSACR